MLRAVGWRDPIGFGRTANFGWYVGTQKEVRSTGKNSRVHICWRPWCSPYGWVLQHVRSGWTVVLVMARGLGGILLRIIITFSSVNPMFLFPHLPPSIYPNHWIFPCNHSLFCFPSKIPSCPFLPQCSHPPSFFHTHLIFSSFPMKPLPSFLFYNWPFQFPTFCSHFFLLLSSFLISWTLLSLVPPIIFFPQFVFPLLSLCIASLSCSGFPGGISSFTLLVQVMGRGGMAAA